MSILTIYASDNPTQPLEKMQDFIVAFPLVQQQKNGSSRRDVRRDWFLVEPIHRFQKQSWGGPLHFFHQVQCSMQDKLVRIGPVVVQRSFRCHFVLGAVWTNDHEDGPRHVTPPFVVYVPGPRCTSTTCTSPRPVVRERGEGHTFPCKDTERFLDDCPQPGFTVVHLCLDKRNKDGRT